MYVALHIYFDMDISMHAYILALACDEVRQCIYTHIYIYVYVCICICMCVYIYICTRMHIYIYNICVCAHVYVSMHNCMDAGMHLCMNNVEAFGV